MTTLDDLRPDITVLSKLQRACLLVKAGKIRMFVSAKTQKSLSPKYISDQGELTIIGKIAVGEILKIASRKQKKESRRRPRA